MKNGFIKSIEKKQTTNSLLDPELSSKSTVGKLLQSGKKTQEPQGRVIASELCQG